MGAGLNTTYFNNSGFTETKGRNGWNNVMFDNSGGWLNQIYTNTEISKVFDISREIEFMFTTRVMYQYELMNSD
ncbi:hypothetical protein HB016_002872 [Salmonella enterica subsp. enterica]|nr:hypothetical protein [Salmonella enterica]ECD7356879.1 hypothetical protein [Salmonella enterica subsp. enterica serovar Poano]ECY1972283.1 hypothetical protein [Salmonella enterica]EDD7859476.1 hypothetical protein [Salmonella enterica subsp. enterica serovar Poano]EDS3695518.1 hypothetical protein [Salmonella enterica]